MTTPKLDVLDDRGAAPCCLGRRELLVLAGEAAVVSALAACGGTEQMDMGGPACSGASVATGAEKLQVGEAKLFTESIYSYFVVRDDKGFYCLRNVCAHAGCPTAFNAAAKTFDCTCHGSRYNFDGTLLSGPATSSLTSFSLCRRGDGMLLVTPTGTGNADLTARVK